MKNLLDEDIDRQIKKRRAHQKALEKHLKEQILKAKDPTKTQHQILKNTQYLTRLEEKKLRVRYKQKNAFRRARTRTLIQIGGLVEKAGLLDVLEIPLGENVEEPELFTAKSILYGGLLELSDQLNTSTATQQKILWEMKGRRALEQKILQFNHFS